MMVLLGDVIHLIVWWLLPISLTLFFPSFIGLPVPEVEDLVDFDISLLTPDLVHSVFKKKPPGLALDEDGTSRRNPQDQHWVKMAPQEEPPRISTG